MQKAHNNRTEKELLPQGLGDFLKLMSMEGAEIIHERKDNNTPEKNKINRGSAFCANCGRPARYGMFCSEKCERELYGV